MYSQIASFVQIVQVNRFALQLSSESLTERYRHSGREGIAAAALVHQRASRHLPRVYRKAGGVQKCGSVMARLILLIDAASNPTGFEWTWPFHLNTTADGRFTAATTLTHERRSWV